MGSIILSRMKQLILVLIVLSICTFALMKLAPGDPIRSMLKIDEVAVTFEQKENLRKELNFDKPIMVQYFMWMKSVMVLDFGNSLSSGKPVLHEIGSRILPTFYLTMGGLLVMTVVATVLGTLSAVFKNSWIDHFSRILSYIGASMPTFWLGLLLIYIFSYKLALLPALDNGSITYMILPSITLGLGMAAVYARLLRAGLLESFSQEYIRAARARGLNEWRIVTGHALRSALIPVITMFGMSFGYLLGGSVVVEILFSYPGLGKMVVDAIFKRDYPIIQGYILFTGIVVVFANLLVDLSYHFLDPRIRFERRGNHEY